MNLLDSPVLFVSRLNNHIYRYAGDQKYRNLTNGKAYIIEDADIKKDYFFPLALNALAMKNPLICDMIKIFNQSYEGLLSHGTEDELKELIKSI
jgi:hypothetical protein